ncbi:MAG: hypothetical protein QME51_03685 [Planctomycetota bacterium]|nr:hypothetical protein [Planctomycetota bacterium]
MIAPAPNKGTLKIRGVLTVNEPAEGANRVWLYNTTQTILWTSIGSISAVKIEYSKDNGVSWETIDPARANISGINAYPWLIPDTLVPDFRCLVKLTDVNDSTVYAISGGFKIRGDFTFTSPLGGENWIVYNDPYNKNPYDITWNTSGSIDNVRLYYSTDDFAGFVPPTTTANTRVIITITGNTGVYSWRVPDNIATVKIRVYDALDNTVFRTSNSLKIRGNFIINSPKAMNEWIVYNSDTHSVTYPVTWTTIGTIPVVRIQYWSTSSEDWVTLDNSYDNTGLYDWQVPDDISYGAKAFDTKIRIVDPNDPTLVYKDSPGFKIRGRIYITSPVANDAWIVTKRYLINWVSTGTMAIVRIDYLKGGTGGIWTTIPGAENLSNLGFYEWTIPDDITQDFSTKVRVLDVRDTTIIADPYSQLSPGFKIKGEFTIHQPNGLEQWDVASVYPITWTNLGTIPNVKLEFSRNGLWTDTELVGGLSAISNTGSYNWTIPDRITPATSTVKVRISDTRDLTISDTSDQGFKIRGKFKVTYPDITGIELDVGSVYTITWTTNGSVPNVKLEYSKDNFIDDIHTIITTTLNNNYYFWTTPDDITSPDFKVKVRVSDTRDYDARDDSDNPCKIRAKFTVASPNTSGIIWTVYETRPISWTNTGTVPAVKIEYSTDDFATVTNTIIASLVNGLGSGTTYNWLVPDDITSPNFKIKVRISDTRDYAARDDSDNPIKIKGDFIVRYPNGTENLKVAQIHTISWTTIGTIPNVKLEYFYNSEWLSIITSTSNSTSTYIWQVPDKITLPPSDYTVKVRVSDTRDPTVTYDTSDSGFKIKADITVNYPNGGENILVATLEPITWTVIGTVPTVRIEYSMDNFVDPAKTKVITTTLNNTDVNVYYWLVPDDISAGQVTRIRVVDTRDASDSYDTSNAGFRIRGWFDVTKPVVDDAYIVGGRHPIQWTTFGTMPTVKLLYSKDNFTDDINIIKSALSNSVGANTFIWLIPDDITPDDRVKVRIVLPTDEEIYDDSVGFKIRADIIVTKPFGAERWVTNETHTINWVITGTVPSVALYYSTDDFVEDIQLITDSTPNNGSYYWKIPDRGGLKPKSKVMVCDTRDLLSFGRSPNFFRIDYYYITFVIKDSVTRDHLRALTFMDPTRGWSEYPVSSPRMWGYPYGTYTTIISKTGYLEEAIELWEANIDKTYTRYMDSAVVHSWQIPVDFKYDPANDSLLTTAWFMRDGLIMYEPPPQRVRIDIYDQQGNFVKTLESSTPNENGVFIINWANTGLKSNTTYWARTELVYSDVPFRSAFTYNINVPTKLHAIAQSTTGLPENIQQIITTAEGIKTKTEKIEEIATGIKRDTGGLALVPEVTEKLAQVSDQLSEKMGDVRKMIVEEIKDQFVRGIQSEILTRYTVVKSGETVPIRYRLARKGLAPVINVYDARNTQRVVDALMTEVPTPEGTEGGTYEYNLTFYPAWGKGEFRILCSESTTRALDSLSITVIDTSLEDIGTAARIQMGRTDQKDMTASLQTIQDQVGAVLGTVIGLKSSTAEGKTDANLLKVIYTDVSSIANRIRDLSTSMGYNFDNLVKQITDSSKEEDIKAIMNGISTLMQLEEINRKILERTEQKFLISVRYDWGSVKITIVAINKSAEPQRIEVKSYLPQELKPEDVFEKGEFEVFYDTEKGLPFVKLPEDKWPLVEPRMSKEYEIRVRDVWTILDKEMTDRETNCIKYFTQLKEGTAVEQGGWLRDKIVGILNEIRVLQTPAKKSAMLVPQYISIYRDNLGKLENADKYLEALRRLAYPELSESGESPLTLTIPGILGKSKMFSTPALGGEGDETLGITAEKSWIVILAVLGFLGLLSIVFFFVWQSHLKRARVSPEFAISPESVKMPEVGSSETETPP